MTQRRTTSALLVLIALSGCIVPIPIPVPEGTPGAIEVLVDRGDPCGAWRLQGFVGQGASAVRAATLPVSMPIRLLEPGRPAIGGTDLARVTFVTDASGRVVTVGCGRAATGEAEDRSKGAVLLGCDAADPAMPLGLALGQGSGLALLVGRLRLATPAEHEPTEVGELSKIGPCRTDNILDKASSG